MPAGPRDDFAIFEGAEHMFFGVPDPLGLIREELERGLGAQVPGTVLEAIHTHDEPRWLTLGRRGEADPNQLVVTYFGVCFRARLAVVAGYASEELEATITLLFGRWDEPEARRMRTRFDLHADAAPAHAPEVFQERFLAFRGEDP